MKISQLRVWISLIIAALLITTLSCAKKRSIQDLPDRTEMVLVEVPVVPEISISLENIEKSQVWTGDMAFYYVSWDEVDGCISYHLATSDRNGIKKLGSSSFEHMIPLYDGEPMGDESWKIQGIFEDGSLSSWTEPLFFE